MGKYTDLVENTLNEGIQYVLFYPSIYQGEDEDYKIGFKSEKEALAWGKKHKPKDEHSELRVEKMTDAEVKKKNKQEYERWLKQQDHLPGSQQDQDDY